MLEKFQFQEDWGKQFLGQVGSSETQVFFVLPHTFLKTVPHDFIYIQGPLQVNHLLNASCFSKRVKTTSKPIIYQLINIPERKLVFVRLLTIIDKCSSRTYFFLFISLNICCGYSKEPSQ